MLQVYLVCSSPSAWQRGHAHHLAVGDSQQLAVAPTMEHLSHL